MLWWLVNTEILGEGTACSFSIWQSWMCKIHEDLNIRFMEYRPCVRRT